jgi:AmpD protein
MVISAKPSTSLALDSRREWLLGVRRVPSPNCDARAADTRIDAIVIHGISLPPKVYGGPYIEHFFTNQLDCNAHPYFQTIAELRVSAHLLIDRQGRITQFVPFSARARHAGTSALEGKPDCNEYSIGIELEGCDDEAYAPRQYAALGEVVNVLRRHWPAITRQRIVGHSDVAPGRKTDPGPAFDWDYFFTLIE